VGCFWKPSRETSSAWGAPVSGLASLRRTKHRRRIDSPRCLLIVGVMLTLAPSLLRAADLHNVLTGYSLTSWGEKDGLPPSVIWAIARDQEGYLWLGTDNGPFRFDGVRFVSWRTRASTPLPEAPVRALLAGRDGSIWLGFGEPGGVSRLLNGEIQNYGREQGLPAGAITMLVQERDGSISAANRQGLFRFTGNRWESAGHGLPKSIMYTTFVDGRGHEHEPGPLRKAWRPSRWRSSASMTRSARRC